MRSVRGLFGGNPAVPAAPAPAPAATAAVAPGGIDKPIHAPSYVRAGDPLNRLPRPARLKAARLREVAEEASALLQHWSAQRNNAASEKVASAAYLDDVRKSRATGLPGQPVSSLSTFMRGTPASEAFSMQIATPGKADENQLRAAEVRAAEALTALADIDRRIAELRTRLSRLPQRIEGWIEDLPQGTKIALHDGAPAGGKSVKPAPEAVAELRERISKLRAEISEVNSAPPQPPKSKTRCEFK